MIPDLTVLMAVRNGGAFLPTAVESILRQSYRDFRFLIVDDASTDRTRERLREYASRDPRVELLCLEQNAGQTAALNIGLHAAQSRWIARMDADDYSAPNRLEEQMRAISGDPSLACVGTFAWEFREDPLTRQAVILRPERYPEIRRAALYGAGIIHGTIVVRRDALLEIGGYDERYRYASDRDMFIRFLPGHRAVNIPQPLLGIRRHPGQDSFSRIAADEYVDIFERLLRGERRSAEERKIIRRSLAYSHIFRARSLWAEGRAAAGWKDQFRAMRISPRTFLRSSGGALLRGLVPKRRWPLRYV